MGGWQHRDWRAPGECDLGDRSGSSTRTDDSTGDESLNSSPSEREDRASSPHERTIKAYGSALRIDMEWQSFASQWHHPLLRVRVAGQMPFIVSLIWHDEFIELANEHTNTPKITTQLISASDQEAHRLTKRFIDDVLSRTRISAVAFLLALFFIHRYRSRPDETVGHSGSQYRMFVVGLLLAQKYTEDHPFSNRVWAQLARMPVPHINVMEREFLANIDHRLGVKLRDFQRWVVTLDGKFGWTASLLLTRPTISSNIPRHHRENIEAL